MQATHRNILIATAIILLLNAGMTLAITNLNKPSQQHKTLELLPTCSPAQLMILEN